MAFQNPDIFNVQLRLEFLFCNHGLKIQTQCMSDNFAFALKCRSSSEAISGQNLMAAMVL